MPDETRGDYFDRARTASVALLIAAGVAAILGALLDWVTISPAGPVQGEFGDEPFDVRNVSEPFTGIDAGDGWYVVGAGGAIVVFACLLLLMRRRGWAWGALLASVVMGAIAISAFREVDDLSSDLSRRMEVVGDADPAFGLTLVAVAAVVGVVSAAIALAATPGRDGISRSAA